MQALSTPVAPIPPNSVKTPEELQRRNSGVKMVSTLLPSSRDGGGYEMDVVTFVRFLSFCLSKCVFFSYVFRSANSSATFMAGASFANFADQSPDAKTKSVIGVTGRAIDGTH